MPDLSSIDAFESSQQAAPSHPLSSIDAFEAAQKPKVDPLASIDAFEAATAPAGKQSYGKPTNARFDSSKLHGVDPALAGAFTSAWQEAAQQGLRPVLTSGYRSFEKQQSLWLDRANSRFPVAKPGNSKHEVGQALDVQEVNGKQDALAAIFAKHGLYRPHGNDPIHFQLQHQGAGINGIAGNQGWQSLVNQTDSPAVRQKLDQAFPHGSGQPPLPGSLTGPPSLTPGHVHGTPYPETPSFVDLTSPATEARAARAAGLPEPQGGIGAGIAESLQTGMDLAHFALSGWRALKAAANEIGNQSAAVDNRVFTITHNGKKTTVPAASAWENAPKPLDYGTLAGLQKVGQAAAAGFNSEGDTPLNVFRNMGHVKTGETPWWQALPYYALDKGVEFTADPINYVGGKAIEAGLPLLKGAAKLGLKGAEKVAPVAVAALRGVPARLAATDAAQAVARALGVMGFGPDGALKRGLRRLTAGEEAQIQDYNQILNVARDAHFKLRVPGSAYEEAVQSAKGKPLLDSPLGKLVRDYLSNKGSGLPVSNVAQDAGKLGISYDLVKGLGDAVESNADQSLYLLRRYGSEALSARLPGYDPSIARGNFLLKYWDQGLGRRGGQALGEVGATAKLGGTEIAALRQAQYLKRIAAVAQDGKYVRDLPLDRPLPKGWKRFPADGAMGMHLGDLAGKAAPAPVRDYLINDTQKITNLVRAGVERLGTDPYLDETTQGVHRAVYHIGRTTGAIKRNLITRLSTLVTNFMSNAAVVQLGLEQEGLHRGLGLQAFPEAFSETHGFLKTGAMSADIEEFSKYSNAFRSTQMGTADLAGRVTAKEVAGLGGQAVRVAGRDLIIPATQEELRGSLVKGAKRVILGEDLTALHGQTEQTFKLAMYKALKAGGKSPEEAAQLVDKYLFDYSDRAVLLEAADKYGLYIFNAFPAKAYNLFLDTVVHHPEQVWKYKRLRDIFFEEPGAPEDSKNLPEQAKGPFTLPVGRDKDGTHFLDFGRMHPLTGPINTISKAVEGYQTGGLQGSLMSQVPKNPEEMSTLLGHSIFGSAIAPFVNRKLYGEGNQDYYHSGATNREKNRQVASEEYKAFAPGFHTDFIRVMDAFKGVASSNSRKAEVQTKLEALLKSGLGLAAYRSETPGQQEKRVEKLMDRRSKVAGDYIDMMDKVNTIKTVNPVTKLEETTYNLKHNPYHFEEISSTDEAKPLLMAAKGWKQQLLFSGRVVDTKGRLTTEGTRKLTEVTHFLQALSNRMDELDKAGK